MCKKLLAHSSLEPPLEYNHDQMTRFWQNKVHFDRFDYLGSHRNIMQFQIVIGGETGKEMPQSWKLEFLERFSANDVAFSDVEDNTSRLLNRGGVTDLPLLRTLLAIRQVTRAKFLESNGFFSFISICKIGSFKNPFAKITSLSELYFRIRRFILLVQTKKSDFYQLWQQHKLLKTAMKQGKLLWIWWKVNRNWNNMIRISQWRKSNWKTNTSVRRYKSKRAGLWES